MSEEVNEWDSGQGRIVERYEKDILVFEWFESTGSSGSTGQHDSEGDAPSGIEMVRFDPDSKTLSIFPKVNSQGGYKNQFDKVVEIQLDTSVHGWHPDSSVGEGELGELEISGLPKGFGKTFAYGLGFQRKYRGLIRAIEKTVDCSVVRFGSSSYEGFQDDIFYIDLDRFTQYKRAVDRNRGRGDDVVRRVNKFAASEQIAEVMGTEKEEISLGRIPIIRAMTRAVSNEVPFDAEDRSTLITRMSVESKRAAEEQPLEFGQLRRDIELVSLEILIEQYGKGLVGEMAKSEAMWQEFFEVNTFALQQLFAAPIALYGPQLSLRIPNINGAGGRIADFVLVNTLMQDVIIVEIKTPSTILVGSKYRGAEGAEIYPPHKELSGAVAQLQAQMESVVTDLPSIISQTKNVDTPETASVRGAIIVGSYKSLDREQKMSFLRYRNGLHAISILTFDEVRGRLQALQEMLTSRP